MFLLKRNLFIKITNTPPAFTYPKQQRKHQNKAPLIPTIKISARRQWRLSGVFNASPKHTQHPAPVSPSPTPTMQLPAAY